MLTVKSAFVSRVGKFRLVTVGSLVHGSPYVLRDERIGWFSFTEMESKAYAKKHILFDEAKKLIDVWFKEVTNYNLAASTWNSMDTGVLVPLKKG